MGYDGGMSTSSSTAFLRLPVPSRPTLAALAFAFLGVLPACSSTQTVNSASAANPLDSEESSLLYQLNMVREQAGITDALVVCKSLNVSASKHADSMRDDGYLADEDPAGGDVRSRACDAGFTPGCNKDAVMAELVASGIDEGKKTLDQWLADATSKPIALNPDLKVAGVGRSLAEDGARWALDLAHDDDPSCE